MGSCGVLVQFCSVSVVRHSDGSAKSSSVGHWYSLEKSSVGCAPQGYGEAR